MSNHYHLPPNKQSDNSSEYILDIRSPNTAKNRIKEIETKYRTVGSLPVGSQTNKDGFTPLSFAKVARLGSSEDSPKNTSLSQIQKKQIELIDGVPSIGPQPTVSDMDRRTYDQTFIQKSVNQTPRAGQTTKIQELSQKYYVTSNQQSQPVTMNITDQTSDSKLARRYSQTLVDLPVPQNEGFKKTQLTHVHKVQQSLQPRDSINTDIYDPYCTSDQQSGLTIPITRVKKFQKTNQVEKSVWKEQTIETPKKEVHQIKLECDQKVVVQGQHLRKFKKDVPTKRYTMVCEKVPVKKIIKKLVCVPVIKTIEVETTDIKEVEEEVTEIEERWVKKEIIENKQVDDYEIKPYEKIVTIPYIQIQEIAKNSSEQKTTWKEQKVVESETIDAYREVTQQENVLAYLNKDFDQNRVITKKM